MDPPPTLPNYNEITDTSSSTSSTKSSPRLVEEYERLMGCYIDSIIAHMILSGSLSKEIGIEKLYEIFLTYPYLRDVHTKLQEEFSVFEFKKRYESFANNSNLFMEYVIPTAAVNERRGVNRDVAHDLGDLLKTKADLSHHHDNSEHKP